uniref:Uncharacterized protein n=1 Tax=Knipowitschia caucasica TaxID=637954 RepID=A0AAV2LGI2_KNICA
MVQEAVSWVVQSMVLDGAGSNGQGGAEQWSWEVQEQWSRMVQEKIWGAVSWMVPGAVVLMVQEQCPGGAGAESGMVQEQRSLVGAGAEEQRFPGCAGAEVLDGAGAEVLDGQEHV